MNCLSSSQYAVLAVTDRTLAAQPFINNPGAAEGGIAIEVSNTATPVRQPRTDMRSWADGAPSPRD
ncbi:hypothetical protein ACFQ7G_33715 [Streptomyces massasporeus]